MRKSLLGRFPLFSALALLAWTCGCRGFGGARPAPARVTVMTYNIYHGADANGKSNLDAVAAIVKRVRPDVVAFQEVDHKTTRANGLDLTAELSKRTGMPGLFGKAMDFAGGGYGEAVLSRLPIVESVNHPLPHLPGAEPRAALEVRVRLPGGEELSFIGTHLDHQRKPANRLMQTRQLTLLFGGREEPPSILAGDLNAAPGSAEIALLEEHWTRASGADPAPTWPSVAPRQKIDYVMFRPRERWRVVSVEVLDEQVASDHRPVVAVLELLRPDSER